MLSKLKTPKKHWAEKEWKNAINWTILWLLDKNQIFGRIFQWQNFFSRKLLRMEKYLGIRAL